ncbi:short-chain dehydrogenase [candidate division LCP-89 bacterium B3_LCP]|uniref:Short-chain dehydrogenase n=1 Tax=candidate division LCP-89 bacterium B3_LCP TaxID=2012998 RepID=A0A532UZI5_UNCL8|nr:MAG: short-chain dehydrogenase [candidate division LCP-89 bacterium B3_LCP]
MDIKGKTVLVLGGWGLVGAAICRRLYEEKPGKIIVASLNKQEAEDACRVYSEEATDIEFTCESGDIFVREEFRYLHREAVLSDPHKRHRLMLDSVEKLSEEILTESTLYRIIEKHKPHLIIDCVNSATGLAYQDAFSGSARVIKEMDRARAEGELTDELQTEIERLLSCMPVPQLIRHIEILKATLSRFKVQSYLKIGTTGTGGMGLNIPYTHSEERPSRVLMAKSAMGGAQSLLLMLLGRTPIETAVSEIKPAAAIAWKSIGYGPITKGGNPIPIVDCPPENAVTLENTFDPKMPDQGLRTRRTLESVYIDTGENGTFSYGEFYALTSIGQMEFVTPEEIADYSLMEIKGASSGYDVISALDASVLGPTYRAGAMRDSALQIMRDLQKKHHTESVAFELLGPPRLSKLLYEVYLLQKVCGSLSAVVKSSPRELSESVEAYISKKQNIRSQILSIGIPILLSDGKSMLRGPEVKIPSSKVEDRFKISPEKIDDWANAGWIDLREKNFAQWQERLTEIKTEIDSLPSDETSSAYHWHKAYWGQGSDALDPGKIVAWVFVKKEGEVGGARIKR